MLGGVRVLSGIPQRCGVLQKSALWDRFWWSPRLCTWNIGPVEVFMMEIGTLGNRSQKGKG